MRVFSSLTAAAALSAIAFSVSADPLTDADYETDFYSAAHAALTVDDANPDDAAYAHLFHTAAQDALVTVLRTPDDSAYARDFYNAASAALREHDADKRLALVSN